MPYGVVTMVTAVNINEGSVYNYMETFCTMVYMSVSVRHRPSQCACLQFIVEKENSPYTENCCKLCEVLIEICDNIGTCVLSYLNTWCRC